MFEERKKRKKKKVTHALYNYYTIVQRSVLKDSQCKNVWNKLIYNYFPELLINMKNQTLKNFFSLKLSTVSFRLTSTGVKLSPKLFALSLDTWYVGTKGLSSSDLQWIKHSSILLEFYHSDSSHMLEDTLSAYLWCLSSKQSVLR